MQDLHRAVSVYCIALVLNSRKDDSALAQRSGRQPAGSRAVVERRDMTLDIDIPPGPVTGMPSPLMQQPTWVLLNIALATHPSCKRPEGG